MRKAEFERQTKETNISAKVNIDGTGEYNISTPDGFFTHMLELFSKHSKIDLELKAKGDTLVDLHHTIEDIGIVLGQTVSQALEKRKGIERYGWSIVPMDEVRCDVCVDLGGRSNLVYKVDFPKGSYDKDKGFDYTLIKEFIKALSDNLKATIHINIAYGQNNHHIAEAIFKGLAKAVSQAVKITGDKIPSTKGTL
ncbi:MAG: imidazoleglycerol-phosphate dehydratase HisB [Elusimicrobiota bacterium]